MSEEVTWTEARSEELRRTLERAVARACPESMAAHRDDIVQNAWLKVREVLSRGEDSEIRTASYLWKVAYTATISEIRRVRRRREDSVEPETIDRFTTADPGDPERSAESRRIGQAIQSCLGGLVAPRRLAVLLHLYGYGLKETANVVGWPAKRADNLLYRGLADLRRCLTGKGVRP